MDVDVVEVLAGEPSHAFLVEEAERPHRRQLVAEEQVHVDRKLRDQRQILVDGLDSVCARVLNRAEVDALAPDDHIAPVLRVEPAQDLDERALAGSVVADETKHLALVQGEVDAAQDDERAEALRHAANLECDLGRGGGGRRRLCGLRVHVPLERATIRSNCAFSAIATMITTPIHT